MNSEGFGKLAFAVTGSIVLILASGCASTGDGDETAARMTSQYTAAEPLKDARKRFEKGDFRIYVVVKGMRGFYPGIDNQVGRYFEQRYGAIELPGAADYYDSDDHPDFVAAATSYASVYNRAMINRLSAAEQTGAGAAP